MFKVKKQKTKQKKQTKKSHQRFYFQNISTLYFKMLVNYSSLTFPMHHFSTPEDIFSGGRERVHWEQMG